MGQNTDVLLLIARRAQLVKQLSDGTASTRSLTQTLNVSRSTVNRALNNLESSKLVQKNNEGYALTHYGQYAYQAYRQLIDRYDTLTAALPLLDYLPQPSAIPGVIFDDATVIRPSPPSPAAPRTRFIDRIRQSEDIVGIGKVVIQRLIEVFHDQLTAHDLQLSLFLDEQVVEHLWHTHHDTLCTALQTDHCMLQSVEQTPPFSLAIVDWTALWLGVYNECGQLQGILRSESSEAVEWAEQRIQQYAEQAEPICPQGRPLEPQRNGSHHNH